MKKTKAGRQRRHGGRRSRPDLTPGLTLTQDYHSHEFEYWPRPTEIELAQLAAQLARGETIPPQQLIQDAWNLYWESCRRLKQDHEAVKRYFEAEDKFDATLSEDLDHPAKPIPQPKTFPIKFRKIELLLLPELKGKTAKRRKIFREFFFHQLARLRDAKAGQSGSFLYTHEPTKPEVNREYARKRKSIFDAGTYHSFAAEFLDWYRPSKAFKLSCVRAEAARRRWQIRREQMLAQGQNQATTQN